jgi:hypothetical protein
MPGIPREVIKHKLGIHSMFKPIKQKQKNIHQKDVKPSTKKSINYLKPGSSS